MDHALEQVRRYYLARNEADHDLEEAIRRARAKGASWAQIGEALGVSRQAAAQKYGKQS